MDQTRVSLQSVWSVYDSPRRKHNLEKVWLLIYPPINSSPLSNIPIDANPNLQKSANPPIGSNNEDTVTAANAA